MMNDYKELISGVQGDAAFRHIISECGADGKVWFDKRFICDYVSHLKHIIEQLVKERDAAVADLKENRVCTVCVYGNDDTLYPCEDCCAYTENRFVWRGVREDNDGKTD